jgi:hypothetical protein
MSVIVTPAGSEPVRFLGKGGTAVDKVELISQNSRGEVESSIAGDGTLSFPDYPDKKSVVVKESDGLSVADFAGMSITTLAFDPQRGLLQVRLEGEAGKVRSRSGTAFTGHRVTKLSLSSTGFAISRIGKPFTACLLPCCQASWWGCMSRSSGTGRGMLGSSPRERPGDVRRTAGQLGPDVCDAVVYRREESFTTMSRIGCRSRNRPSGAPKLAN